VAPIRMVGVSASVNLPLHHKVQKFCSGTGSPGWFRTKGRKTIVVVFLYSLYSCVEQCDLSVLAKCHLITYFLSPRTNTGPAPQPRHTPRSSVSIYGRPM